MNVVLDTLFLRRPVIRYVCPPICEAQFSSTGAPVIVLEEIQRLTFPTGLVIGGVGRTNLLNWSVYPGQICYSVYLNVDPTNPNSPYNLISECTPTGNAIVCSAGWYSITVVDRFGVESAPSTPVFCDGTAYLKIPLPLFPNAVCYNLYKNPDVLNPVGIGYKYWSCFTGNSFEVCASGCYRVSAITPDGETQLSTAVCTSGNCSTQSCPPCQAWDEVNCKCISVPQTCPPGFFEDPPTCSCITAGGGGTVFPLRACKGSPFGHTVVAPDGFASPCTFTLHDGTLPAGINFTQDSPLTASIAGIPTVTGTFLFSVLCVSAQQQALFKFSLTILSAQPNNAGNAGIGKPFSFQFTGVGGAGAPYTFQSLNPPPPSGLVINPDGTLTGTPNGTPGTYTFGVGVTDKDGIQCGISATITIWQYTNSQQHGVMTCPGNPGIISSITIPDGTYGSNADQSSADMQASQNLLNQISADLANKGCACSMPVITPGGYAGLMSQASCTNGLQPCCQIWVNSCIGFQAILATPFDPIGTCDTFIGNALRPRTVTMTLPGSITVIFHAL